jgi:hypothetical protein
MQFAEILVVLFCFKVDLRRENILHKILLVHFFAQFLFLSFSPREILSELR